MYIYYTCIYIHTYSLLLMRVLLMLHLLLIFVLHNPLLLLLLRDMRALDRNSAVSVKHLHSKMMRISPVDATAPQHWNKRRAGGTQKNLSPLSTMTKKITL